MGIHDDGQRNSVWLRFGNRECWPSGQCDLKSSFSCRSRSRGRTVGEESPSARRRSHTSMVGWAEEGRPASPPQAGVRRCPPRGIPGWRGSLGDMRPQGWRAPASSGRRQDLAFQGGREHRRAGGRDSVVGWRRRRTMAAARGFF